MLKMTPAYADLFPLTSTTSLEHYEDPFRGRGQLFLQQGLLEKTQSGGFFGCRLINEGLVADFSSDENRYLPGASELVFWFSGRTKKLCSEENLFHEAVLSPLRQPAPVGGGGAWDTPVFPVLELPAFFQVLLHYRSLGALAAGRSPWCVREFQMISTEQKITHNPEQRTDCRSWCYGHA